MAELLIAAFLLIQDGGPADCNRLAFAMSAIASEAANQDFEAQLNIARAVRDNAPCGNPRYLSGYAIALRDPDAPNHHARAYFHNGSFAQELRDRWAFAAWLAYTEEPRVTVRHFDRAGSDAWWWESKQACPNGWVEIDQTRFC